MSFSPLNIYGATPATTRGKPIHVGGDPKGNNWVYTSGSTVFVRNVKDPLKTEQYTEHQHQTTVARYAPSGFYIASGDISGTVRIWDTTQKEHILKIELKVISGPITDLQWSEDSKRIVAVGEGKDKFGSVFLWDTGSSVGEITGHAKPITTADFKQTRPYRLATGSEDFSVAWLEGPPFKFKTAFKEHTRFVNCVRFSPDGNKLLTVGSDKLGFFHDGKTGDAVGKLSETNGHTAGIYACSWSSDSKRVVTVSADKTAKIWDSDTGNCLKTFTVSDNPQVEHQLLGCLWQGDIIIAIALSGDIYYFDPSGATTPTKIVRGHNKLITALAFDSNANQLYSASYDGLVVRWDVNSGATEALEGKGHSNQVNSIHIQGSNLVSCAMDDTVRITPIGSRKYSDSAIKLDSTPSDIAVGKKNQSLIVAAITDSLVVIKDGHVASKLQVKYQPLTVALSVDETHLAVGGKDNNVYIYNLAGTSLSEAAVLKGHRGALSVVSYSPDGQYLASADTNREILVWDRKNNQIKIQGWVFHSAKVNSLSWSPDSHHLASGGLDGIVFIWDLEKTDKRIQIRDAHRGGVNGTLWLDNNTVASAGQDCSVKTWSIKFH